MSKCPNCYYELVLLEKRRKYKCAKCGKLFPQHDIEVKEFHEFNKRQKKFDREEIFGKPQHQTKLTEFEKKQRRKEYYEKNKDKLLKHKADYYESNRNTLVEKSRHWRKQLSG